MLTKTRKWILVFILAFVALFLVACQEEEPEPEQIKPQNLTVEVVAFVGNKATVVGKAPMKVVVTSTTENADLSVNWSSSDEAIATVDAEGLVTGKKAGYATITATSTLDETVKGSVEIRVYDKEEHINNDLKALLDAADALQAAMPEFIDEDMDLPKPANKDIKVVYKDEDDNIYVNGKYIYSNYINDRYETINVEMSYGKEKMTFPYQVRIVEDVVDNDFNAIKDAEQYVEKYLSAYKDGLKVFGNITFPKSLKELKTYYNVTHTGRDVTISWKSTNTSIIENTGTFIRPNDDTNVTLEAYFTSNNISSVQRHTVVAKGYTSDEMVDEILSAIPTVVQAKNITLPTYVGKFAAVLEWTSDKPATLSAIGKTDPFIAEEEVVTLTVEIKYPGTTSDDFAFERTENVLVTVKPAANDAQAVALELSNRYETEIASHFPYGAKDRESGNTLPLPTTVGGTGEFKDVAVTWTSGEEGLFNSEWVLQKQFLRYHAVTLTYSVTIDGNTATGEVVVNTGIAEKSNTIYAGGNMYSRNTSQAQPYDELHQLSALDGPSGVIGSTLNVYGWSGITYYTDIEEDGLVTRYQFFASNLYSISLDDYDALDVDFNNNNAVIDGAERGNGTQGTNNRQYTIVNNTEYELGIPVITNAALAISLEYNARTTLLPKDLGGQALAPSGMGMRINYNGFVVDGEGNVILGYGTTTLLEGIMADYEETDTLPNAIKVPAGGFAVSGEFAAKADLIAKFANVGQKVFLEQYNVQE